MAAPSAPKSPLLRIIPNIAIDPLLDTARARAASLLQQGNPIT